MTGRPSRRLRSSRTVWPVATAAGLALDHLLGDPPDRMHPVAWFGAAMGCLEAAAWRDSRSRGVLHALAGTGGAAVVGWLLHETGRRAAGPVGEAAAAMIVAAAVIGARSLDVRAEEIHEALSAGRIDQARRLLPSLVGRNPTGMEEDEIARAVVESLAENSVDAVVAPLLWSAAAGPAGAAAYRAVNTLDAMVGHRNLRYRNFGWASARLDDIANHVPARLAAAMVAALTPRRAAVILRTVRRQAGAHPSPNAGVIEAAFAAALDLRLGGTNDYDGVIEQRPALGEGRAPIPDDIRRTRALARRLHVATAAALALPSALRLAGQLARRSARPTTGGGEP